MWRIFAAAALTFLPYLFLQYVGEEAVTVVVTQEMWARGDFAVTTLYGGNYGRPGLFSWLMLPPTLLLGWDQILPAARLVTIVATLVTGATLAWLVRRIFRDDLLAAFAAAVYLSGDVLLYRGWLSYADPLYACFIFAAMACLWVATAERSVGLLVVATTALIASFLTKTVTGYVFYGVLGLVLLWRHPHRGFLLRPASIALHAAALGFPFWWDEFVARGTVLGVLMHQFRMPLNNLEAPDPVAYVTNLLRFPIRTAWYLLPTSVVALGCLVRARFALKRFGDAPIAIAAFAALINVLPYWLSPDGGTRYLLPIYPLAALLMARVVLRSGAVAADVAVRGLIAAVAVAAVVGVVGFPLYERHVRGSYEEAARAVLARVGDHPLYAADSSSVGTSIVAHLNTMRRPRPPIVEPPALWSEGFVLAIDPQESVGRIAERIEIGKRVRYLLCRGRACDPHG